MTVSLEILHGTKIMLALWAAVLALAGLWTVWRIITRPNGYSREAYRKIEDKRRGWHRVYFDSQHRVVHNAIDCDPVQGGCVSKGDADDKRREEWYARHNLLPGQEKDRGYSPQEWNVAGSAHGVSKA